jgi:hypothetical protein
VRIGIVFNVPLNAGVPGFRVGLPDDEGDPVRRPSPIALGPASFIMAPTDLAPAGLFYNADNGLSPPPSQAYIPVSGDLPAQDPLRQAMDRMANLPAEPGKPAASPLTATQLGGLIGAFLGGTVGSVLSRNPHVGRAAAGAGGGIGMFLGGEYDNGNAGRAISIVNDSGLAGAPGSGL